MDRSSRHSGVRIRRRTVGVTPTHLRSPVIVLILRGDVSVEPELVDPVGCRVSAVAEAASSR